MMTLIRHIVLLVALLLSACNPDNRPIDEQPEQPTAPRLTSIVCATERYTITAGGSIEVTFTVEEADAQFDYDCTSESCDVALCYANQTTTATELDIIEIRADDNGQGRYHAKIADNTTATEYDVEVSIAITTADGVVSSNAIHISLSSVEPTGSITAVALRKSSNPGLSEDVIFDYDAATMTFSTYVDDYISERVFIPEFTSEGVDRIEVNGRTIDKAGTPIDLSRDVTAIAYVGESAICYTLHFECFTTIPVLHINTPGRVSINSRDKWVEGATLRLDGMGHFDDIETTTISIRGRGNSTWGYPKRPYTIRFDQKCEVMGMPKHKRWVLLANYMDRTLLRNRVAHFLADKTSLQWTPRCEYVELILNGLHLGQYLLTEQVRVDNDRIDITEMTAADNAGEAITGGYLLELDFHFDNQWQWHSSHNIPFAVKYPDEEDLTTEQFNWIKGHINDVEAVLYGSNYTDRDSGYESYIDTQSFVDYWLIYELCVNHELANPGSVYLTKDRNGKLTAGPIWDFDWGTFSFQASPAAQSRLFMTHAWWYGRLFSDDSFKALASERWQVLRPQFIEVFDFIDREREYIRRSWSVNFDFWDITTNTNGDERLDFDAAVDRMKEVIQKRIDIIDRELQW